MAELYGFPDNLPNSLDIPDPFPYLAPVRREPLEYVPATRYLSTLNRNRMKNLLLPALLVLLLASCGRPSAENQTDGTATDSTDANQVLYDQVMDIHDEVMPKMGDIEELKRKLRDQIAASPNMVVEERKKLERRIANLDSVGNLMMDWMHKFSPLPDSLGQEAAREYYESELERIKQVRDAMLGIIEEEKKNN